MTVSESEERGRQKIQKISSARRQVKSAKAYVRTRYDDRGLLGVWQDWAAFFDNSNTYDRTFIVETCRPIRPPNN